MIQSRNIEPAEALETVPALDMASILAIHRHTDGFIGFCRKPDPAAPPRLDRYGKPYQFENVCSIRVSELSSMFPEFAAAIMEDSYFTINSPHRAAPYLSSITNLPGVWRKESDMRWLTACYVDVDSGRPDSEEPGGKLSWREARNELECMADLNIIPHPSIFANSGRGVYALWLLVDSEDSTKQQRAFLNSTIPLYKAINRELVNRIRNHDLPADTKAIDAARVLRVPGSIHRKAMRRVGYQLQGDAATGKGFIYTLPELAKFLGIPATSCELPDKARRLAKPATYRRVKNPGSAPARSRGMEALNSKRAQDLLRISQWRGGFLKRGQKYPDGSTSPGRRCLLTLYANFLRGSGVDQAEALEALRSMASTMRPPYPSDTPDQDPPIETLVEAEYKEAKRLRYKDNLLCSWLGVTEAVARDLELLSIRPRNVAIEADQARPLQADLIAERRDFARQYIERYGRITARRLANVYAAHGFLGANPQTANQDMQALGWFSTRSTGGRPRKAAL